MKMKKSNVSLRYEKPRIAENFVIGSENRSEKHIQKIYNQEQAAERYLKAFSKRGAKLTELSSELRQAIVKMVQ
ncbi:MAG TPA: hypothetical protein VMW72_10805 [Sedimentisphaerales bacterium]|nr:hypothetical protein [Sedimentisphaerales bacterium]